MRIGLFGGSFDPVHHGHLLVARAALEELRLDRLVFIPAALSPFKPGTEPAPATMRLRMLRLALAGQTQYTVDDSEIRRGGVSYSIETVREFGARHPGSALFWLIGADHVVTLPLWRAAESLASMVEFVVIPRPGVTIPSLPPGFRLHQMRGWPLRISASEIRERLRSGLPVDHLVPAPVASLLETEPIYGT